MNVAGYLAAPRRPSRTDALRRAVAASATVLEHHRARRTLFLLCLLFFGLHLAPSQGRDAGFIERTVKERGLEGTSQRPRAAAKPPLDVDFLKRNRRLVLFWNRVNQGGGGAEEDRTPDPLRARQVLSQLSYGPDLVGLGGLEPPASPLSGVRSNQLSYRPLGDLLARRLPKTQPVVVFRLWVPRAASSGARRKAKTKPFVWAPDSHIERGSNHPPALEPTNADLLG